MSKILWISRHEPSPATLAGFRALHGEDVQVDKKEVVFESSYHILHELIEARDVYAMVYLVAPAHMLIDAALHRCVFGLVENHPARRASGQFGLKAIYHVRSYPDMYAIPGDVVCVYSCPDPESDCGDLMAHESLPEPISDEELIRLHKESFPND